MFSHTPARVVGMPSRSTSRTTFVLFVSVRGEGRSGRSRATEFRGGGVGGGRARHRTRKGTKRHEVGDIPGQGQQQKSPAVTQLTTSIVKTRYLRQKSTRAKTVGKCYGTAVSRACICCIYLAFSNRRLPHCFRLLRRQMTCVR